MHIALADKKLVGRNDHLHRPQRFVAVEIEQRAEIIVIHAVDHQHRLGDDRGLCERQDNFQKNPAVRHSVDLRRVFQRIGKFDDKLPEKEDRPYPSEHSRHGDGQRSARPLIHIGHQDIAGNHREDSRKHHRSQKAHKDDVSAREAEFGKGIRRRTAAKTAQDYRGKYIQQRISERTANIRAQEHIGVVLELRILEKPSHGYVINTVRSHSVVEFERTYQYEKKGDENQSRHRNKDGIPYHCKGRFFDHSARF